MQKIHFSKSLMAVAIVTVFVLSSISFLPHSYSSGSVTITIDRSSYRGTETIHVSGIVSPPPKSSGTFVAVSITSPSGGTVDANQFVVATITGKYNGTFVTGGPNYATSGTYTIIANYNGAVASTSFHYGTSRTITLQINRTHYSETQQIFVSGLISPVPRVKGTHVAVTITGPNGATVDVNQFLVLANYGTFTGSFLTGGPLYTLSGTYKVTANYNGAIVSVVFSYSA